MDITLNLHEAHLSNGTTLPLRKGQTKKGEPVFAVMDRDKAGNRIYNGWGPKVAPSVVGDLSKLSTIKVEGVGTLKVRQDLTEKGQKRYSARKDFTAADGETWLLSFRVTVISPEVYNLQAELKRGKISTTRVLTEL